MARLGFSKKKKSPRDTENNQLKKELKRVTEQLKSCQQELTQKAAELESSNSELRESLEQQTTTGEILRVIASSPTDIQSVLDVIAKNAARLCDSNDAQIECVEGEVVRRVASCGTISTLTTVGETRTISRDFFAGLAILDRQTTHIQDVRASREVRHPDWGEVEHRRADELGVARTALATPLMREGVPIGAIVIRRTQSTGHGPHGASRSSSRSRYASGRRGTCLAESVKSTVCNRRQTLG